MHCNSYVKLLIKDKKESRVIYDILGQTYEANVPNRWFNEVGNIIVDEWKQYSTSLKYINDMQLSMCPLRRKKPFYSRIEFHFSEVSTLGRVQSE